MNDDLRLNVGFDGKRAVRNSTGLGNYSRLAVEVLSHHYPYNDYRLYAPTDRSIDRFEPLMKLDNVTLVTPDTTTGRLFPSAWRVSGMTRQLRRDGVQLFHGLSNELPAGIERLGIPTVVTIHDVIFRRYPEYYKPIDRLIYDVKFRSAARRATRVIAISECTARELQHFYDIDPAKIDIIYQGCDAQFGRPIPAGMIDAVKNHYGINGEYIIGVGTIERRKNQIIALRALRGLPEDIGLVLVGHNNNYLDEIIEEARRLGLTERLKVIEHADFSDLPALYAGAVLSSYPSRYEGFGIPIIESINSGTPVIIATGSCLEEAAGPSMPAISPDDTDAFIDAARHIISDSSYRDRIVTEGREYVSRFSDAAMAEGIMNSYQRAIDEVAGRNAH